MSRNLGRTDCDRCSGEVVICGPTAPITVEQCGVYFKEYEGMLVADAECTVCTARYLAWVDDAAVARRHGYSPRRYSTDERPFVDLSYRAAFNDEPADEDVPPWVKPADLREQLERCQRQLSTSMEENARLAKKLEEARELLANYFALDSNASERVRPEFRRTVGAFLGSLYSTGDGK